MISPVPLHFVTPVWGKEYTRTFLEVTLPTLLAPGNIPAVPNLADCVYRIYTTPADEAVIRNSASYSKLRELLRVNFVQIQLHDDDKYVTSSECYRDALRDASSARSAAVFLIPDMVLADGGIRSIVALLTSGIRAVLVMGLRAFKDSIIPEVQSTFARNGCINVPPRELVRLGMRHLHSIMRIHLYEGDTPTFNPSLVCWQVADQGFLVHTFHLHPVAVFPDGRAASFSGTIDDDLIETAGFNEKEVYVVTDSDQLVWFEISDRDHFVPGPINRDFNQIVAWTSWATTAFHRDLFRVPIRIHVRELSSDAWLATEQRAQEFVGRLLSEYTRNTSSWMAKVKLRAEVFEYRATARLQARGQQSPKATRMLIRDFAALGVVLVAAAVRKTYRALRNALAP